MSIFRIYTVAIFCLSVASCATSHEAGRLIVARENVTFHSYRNGNAQCYQRYIGRAPLDSICMSGNQLRHSLRVAHHDRAYAAMPNEVRQMFMTIPPERVARHMYGSARRKVD